MEKSDLPQCSKTPPPKPGRKSYTLSADVQLAFSRSLEMAEDERFQLTCELIKSLDGQQEKLKKLMNLARDAVAKAKKNEGKWKTGQLGNQEVSGQQSTVDPGASTPVAGASSAASNVSLICRGDLLAQTVDLFFDTEKVTISFTHENMSGDLSIVDIKGRLLFWCYIQQTDVCKFNSALTGLNKDKMAMGVSLETVKSLLVKLLDGKTMWGAGTSNDIKSLGFNPELMPVKVKLKDIQDFYVDPKMQPISLALLSEHFLGENVQDGKHSSITDARLTALCYRKMVQFKKLGMTRFSCPLMDDIRMDPTQRKQKNPNIKWDRCSCGSKRKNPVPRRNKPTAFESFRKIENFDMDDWD